MDFLNGRLDIALVKNNARVGAQIAVSLSQIREQSSKGELLRPLNILMSTPFFVKYSYRYRQTADFCFQVGNGEDERATPMIGEANNHR